jgi:hypothetical protein
MESRREHGTEELQIMRDKASQDKRIAENKKIRCPCCKKNQYFDKYLANPQLGTLVCSLCGVLFIDKDKIKIIKQNITNQKARAGSNIILPR